MTCWYDYTCRYSYRALLWLERVARADADVEVRWATFSLREANREADARSLFDDPEVSSVSVLALALAHAAREADFDAYHRGVFEAMHGDGDRVRPEGLIRIAERAGVDIAAFDRERPRWLRAVADEHAEGVSRHGVFGTPTLEIGEDAAVFLKLADPPDDDEAAARLWSGLCTISVCHPELVEIKRPLRG